MAEIHHELKVKAEPSAVFAALTSEDGLKAWYSADAKVEGSGWRIEHADHPTFAFEVTESTAPAKVVWKCTEGPNDSVGTTVTYTVSDAGDGRTLVELAHTEWPGTHGNYRKCNTFWGVLMHHLRQYLETGNSSPAF